MSDSHLDILMKVIGGNEDSRVDAVDGLAHNPEATREEVITTLDVLQRVTMDPSPKVRISACYALMRCVAESRNFELHDRQSAKDAVEMMLESMENDRDPDVYAKVLEIEKAVRQLARWQGLR